VVSARVDVTAGQLWTIADGVVPSEEAAPTTGQEHAASGFPVGSQIVVRDELWLVRDVKQTQRDGWMLEVTGVSPFVRGMEAVFFEQLEHLSGDDERTRATRIQRLEPRETKLVADSSPNHRRARLFLEAVIRRTFLPQTEHGLALADGFLMNPQTFQLRPAQLALSMRNPQPRLLIADAVGLGKTLEIGVLLAELVRRGRGERILVVTPKSVLEQFQRELWTRFGLPLVRLDSAGVQRVQREIPAGRNPFAYFKRVIISVDTLKDPTYAPHLEKTDWDAVVIDESHNLINRGTQNNDLARLLSTKTDALILASATPHNGDARSFAELIRMLDEAAIANPATYDVGDLQHLYIRRTKTSPEVREGLRDDWADRLPPVTLALPASPAEEAVLDELRTVWIPADQDGPSPSSVPLFPYQMFKAFLSSHQALLSMIRNRVATIERGPAKKTTRRRAGGPRPTKASEPEVLVPPQLTEKQKAEREALLALRELAERITDDDSSKLAGLVDRLTELGVGPGSDVRVVVFSESIPTLNWLARVVPPKLGFKPGRLDEKDKDRPWKAYDGAVEVMHGEATSEDAIRDLIEKFGLRDEPVRLLFTGDLASEGVNLHQQCHQLIHYDLPWSLIRIEQRNGRIDRYGQRAAPQIAALLLTSDAPWRTKNDEETGIERVLTLDDRLVGEKLLRREEQAHRIEGSAEAVTGLFDADVEEDRLIKDLLAGRTVEQSITGSRQSDAEFLADLLGQVGTEEPSHPEVLHAQTLTVFPAQKAARPAEPPMTATEHYFATAIDQIFPPGPDKDRLALRHENDGTIAFSPPPELVHRLKALPQSYLTEQQILPTAQEPGRVKVTFRVDLGHTRLTAARESSSSQWPTVSYVTDIHPVLDWVTDKVLVEIGRNQAPVLAANVSEPTFLVQGIYSNALGRPTVVAWMAITGLPGRAEVRPITQDLLTGYGLGPLMPGRAVPVDLARLQTLIPAAVDAAETYLETERAAYDEQIAATLAPYRTKVDSWKDRQLALFVSVTTAESKTKTRIDGTVDRLRQLTDSLETTGQPMLRVLAALEPLSAGARR